MMNVTIYADGSQKSRDVIREALPLIEAGVVAVQPAPKDGDMKLWPFAVCDDGPLDYNGAMSLMRRLKYAGLAERS